jgi:hypothetical protein
MLDNVVENIANNPFSGYLRLVLNHIEHLSAQPVLIEVPFNLPQAKKEETKWDYAVAR